MFLAVDLLGHFGLAAGVADSFGGVLFMSVVCGSFILHTRFSNIIRFF